MASSVGFGDFQRRLRNELGEHLAAVAGIEISINPLMIGQFTDSGIDQIANAMDEIVFKLIDLQDRVDAFADRTFVKSMSADIQGLQDRLLVCRTGTRQDLGVAGEREAPREAPLACADLLSRYPVAEAAEGRALRCQPAEGSASGAAQQEYFGVSQARLAGMSEDLLERVAICWGRVVFQGRQHCVGYRISGLEEGVSCDGREALALVRLTAEQLNFIRRDILTVDGRVGLRELIEAFEPLRVSLAAPARPAACVERPQQGLLPPELSTPARSDTVLGHDAAAAGQLRVYSVATTPPPWDDEMPSYGALSFGAPLPDAPPPYAPPTDAPPTDAPPTDAPPTDAPPPYTPPTYEHISAEAPQAVRRDLDSGPVTAASAPIVAAPTPFNPVVRAYVRRQPVEPAAVHAASGWDRRGGHVPVGGGHVPVGGGHVPVGGGHVPVRYGREFISAFSPPTPARVLIVIASDIDVGLGNTLYMRGEPGVIPGMSWEQGVPMTWLEGRWVLSDALATVTRPFEYKFVINDDNQRWENYSGNRTYHPG